MASQLVQDPQTRPAKIANKTIYINVLAKNRCILDELLKFVFQDKRASFMSLGAKKENGSF